MANKYAGKKVNPFYRSAGWKAFRVRILERDHYWCQVCRKRWARTVHHKKPIAEYPDLALDEDNCEAICDMCHNQEHPEKGEATRKHPKAAEIDLNGIRVIEV